MCHVHDNRANKTVSFGHVFCNIPRSVVRFRSQILEQALIGPAKHSPEEPSFSRFARALVTLPRTTKRLVMLVADALAIPASVLASVWLAAADSVYTAHPWALVAPVLIGLAALRYWSVYRSVVRFMGFELAEAALKSTTFTAAALFLVVGWSTTWTTAFRAGATFWFLALVYVVGSRLAARWLLQSRDATGDRVVIYGAGDAGAHLVSALAGNSAFVPVAFVDDNTALWGAVVNGLEVHSPTSLRNFIDEFGITRVLLALPSVSRRRRLEVINNLEQMPVHVQTMPDMGDLVTGNARVDDIREVDITDILGRDPVPPNPKLLGACVRGKSVMVTGAGGSIGAELCTQIMLLEPKRLVLLDISEAALYTADQTLQDLARRKSIDVEIVALIGSAHHQSRVREVLETYAVDTVYHAAAYKHVPLVEHNMIEGVHNNVFGTLHTAEAAIAAGVKSFVLVSTDKAVLPTNVMGATKRFAELVLQGLNQRGSGTTFSMVRFGNVLASSGSVVPLFREQIRNGGPVTVTHPEIFRYFMTIPEAASLVIQAGSMGTGGDVFVLDMGKPVRIRDLAEKMIHLMGLKIRDEDHPDGDIEIVYTGLRPAEKLYEELLIGTNVAGTEHPAIMRAEEAFLPWAELKALIEHLWAACQRLDCIRAREVLLSAVTGYTPTKEVEDLVWRQRNAGARATVASNVTPLEPRRVSPQTDRSH
jgi:UDP-N-acetylglucosamine 4,6-dehydratase